MKVGVALDRLKCRWRLPLVWPFDILRGRLLAILVLASGSLIVSAAANAWRDQQALAHAAVEQAQTAIAAAMARHEAAVSSMRRYLSALGVIPDLNGALDQRCDVMLQHAWLLRPEPLAMLAVLDPRGQVKCAIARSGNLRLENVAGWDKQATLRLANGQAVLVVAAPRDGGGNVVGASTVNWLGDPVSRASGAWLLDGDAMFPLGETPRGLLPALRWMPRPPASDAAFLATGQNGLYYAYATKTLDTKLRLLIAVPVSADLTAASALTFQGFVVLTLLLILALMGIALGAHETLAEPIRHLSNAVRRWQEGAPFDGRVKRMSPCELAELYSSFAQATQALAERERQLRNALAQQDLLMQEIHHRVKNNLQIVASLLNLQASRIRLPEARREFQSARDRSGRSPRCTGTFMPTATCIR